MRITGGQYKNRKIICPSGDQVRPTSDRMRQTVFNMLCHAKWTGDFELSEARVLDVYCGTGALGIEALSHGAGHCIFVDRDTSAVRENTSWVDPSYIQIVKSDALKLGMGKGDIDLVFMDPPYRMGLVEPTIDHLIDQDWIADGAIFVIETERQYNIQSELILLESRHQSQSTVHFLSYDANA